MAVPSPANRTDSSGSILQPEIPSSDTLPRQGILFPLDRFPELKPTYEAAPPVTLYEDGTKLNFGEHTEKGFYRTYPLKDYPPVPQNATLWEPYSREINVPIDGNHRVVGADELSRLGFNHPHVSNGGSYREAGLRYAGYQRRRARL